MPHRLYPQVAARAGHRCEYCRAPEEERSTEFEVEHVVTRALGGGDDLDNLALACGSCNRHKGQSIQGIDPVTGLRAPLFDPRGESWIEHFDFIDTEATVVGLSPTGRA